MTVCCGELKLKDGVDESANKPPARCIGPPVFNFLKNAFFLNSDRNEKERFFFNTLYLLLPPLKV